MRDCCCSLFSLFQIAEKGECSSHLAQVEIKGAKEVYEAAEIGDALATKIIDETHEMLGVGCITLCRVCSISLHQPLPTYACGRLITNAQCPTCNAPSRYCDCDQRPPCPDYDGNGPHSNPCSSCHQPAPIFPSCPWFLDYCGLLWLSLSPCPSLPLCKPPILVHVIICCVHLYDSVVVFITV